MHRLLVASLAATGLGLAAAPALAAPANIPFDLRTGKTASAGHNHSYGTVTFHGKGKLTISGRVNDICPGDGAGAYLRARIVVDAGMGDGARFVDLAKDVGGCKDADGVGFTYTLEVKGGFENVTLYATERDADGSSNEGTDPVAMVSIDNPKRG